MMLILSDYSVGNRRSTGYIVSFCLCIVNLAIVFSAFRLKTRHTETFDKQLEEKLNEEKSWDKIRTSRKQSKTKYWLLIAYFYNMSIICLLINYNNLLDYRSIFDGSVTFE